MFTRKVLLIEFALAMLIFSGIPASAVPVFNTSLTFTPFNLSFSTGTNSVADCFIIGGGGFVCGSVDVVGTDIALTANANGGSVTVIESRGEYLFDDFVFSSIGNPGSGGTIEVSANFEVFWTTPDPNAAGDSFTVQSNINGGGFNLNTKFFDPISTDITTVLATVPLDVAVTFSGIATLLILDSFVDKGEFGNGFFRLAVTPFNIPGGFTVNSADAGIFDNSFIVPTNGNGTQVPEPGALALFGIGLTGVVFVRRRKRTIH